MDSIDKINRLCAINGITGADLSRAVGLSNSIYSQWNTRKSRPSAQSLKKIAEYFSVSVDSLLPEEKKSTPEGGHTDAEFMDLFGRASPEIREAVLTLLRSATPPLSTQGEDAKD